MSRPRCSQLCFQTVGGHLYSKVMGGQLHVPRPQGASLVSEPQEAIWSLGRGRPNCVSRLREASCMFRPWRLSYKKGGQLCLGAGRPVVGLEASCV